MTKTDNKIDRMSETETTFLKGLMTSEDGAVSNSQFGEIYERNLNDVAKQFGYKEVLDEEKVENGSDPSA